MFHVERVCDTDVEDAYDVLRVVAEWLKSLGRRQRISATSFDTYLRWQSAGANWIVREDADMAGVFTVIPETLDVWPSVTEEVPVLRALATHPDWRGRGVGAFGIEAALEIARPHELLYLDCVSDFLPSYYAAHGFEKVARQDRTIDGEPWDITLMRRRTMDSRGDPPGDPSAEASA